MGALDPVHWNEIEAVFGPPAADLTAYVEEMCDDVRGEDPYHAVKTVHDAIAEDPDADVSIPDQAEVYLTTYLLERAGAIEPDDALPDGGATGTGAETGAESDALHDGLPSIVDRRPAPERLDDLFWGRERTMWWIAVRLGVHWAVVRHWLYEDAIPIRERNFDAESMARIRAFRDEHERY